MSKKAHLNTSKKKKDEDKDNNPNKTSLSSTQILDNKHIDLTPATNLNSNINISSPVILTRSKRRRSKDSNILPAELELPKRRKKNGMDNKKISKIPNPYTTGSSSDLIKSTLEGLKSNDEMQILSTLTDLCSQLSLANDSLGENANYNELIKQLIVFFDKYPGIPDISMIALNCINYLLDISPRSTNTVIKSGGIEKIVQMAQNVEYIDCVEAAIKAIEKMSFENPFSLVEKDSFYAVLAFIDFFDVNLRKLALKACVNMSKVGNNMEVVKKHILPAVPNLTVLTKLSGNTDIEKSVVDLSVQCFYYILIGVKNYNYSQNHNDFCNTVIQYGLLENIFEIFIRFISLDDTEENNNGNNANTIILQSNTFSINVDTVKTILKIFEALCSMSGDITNIILNNNTLEMIYKVLNREIGAGLSDLNKKKLTSNSHSMYNELFGVLAAVFPKKGEKAEQSRILLEANKFYFLYFSDKILTLLIDNILHIPSSSSMIGVIRIIYMYCTNTPKEYIIKYINEKKLSNIISKNLDSKDSNYIIEVLNLVELIMTRVPEQFVIAFIRDGVHNSIKSLITVEESGLYITKDPIQPFILHKGFGSLYSPYMSSTDKNLSENSSSSNNNNNNVLISSSAKDNLIQYEMENIGDEEGEEDNVETESINQSKPPKISLTKPPSSLSSPSTIVAKIHNRATLVTNSFFSDKDIQTLVEKTHSTINPIKIMSSLNEYTKLIKENKCTSAVLKDIINLMLDNNVTFYEIEKSEIVLYLCSYFDGNFLLNYNNAYDNEKESNVTLSNECNKNIIQKLMELFVIFNNNNERIEAFIKLLQQCISSMNCFKLYLIEFTGVKNYSNIFSQTLSMQNSIYNKVKKMKVKLSYDSNSNTNTNSNTILNDKDNKENANITNTESLQKLIDYFASHSPINLRIASDEPLESLKEKLFIMPLENPDDYDNKEYDYDYDKDYDKEKDHNNDNYNDHEGDIFNAFNKFFKKETISNEDEDEVLQSTGKKDNNPFKESDKVLKFIQEINNITKEKNKEQQPKSLEPITSSQSKDKRAKQKPKPNPIPLTEEEIECIHNDYDIQFYLKLSNGNKQVIDPSISLSDFIKTAKTQIPKGDLMQFISSSSICFTLIDNTLLTNNNNSNSNDDVLMESPLSSISKTTKSESNLLQSLCLQNENEFHIGKLQKILFEKFYFENIVNNKALYNIKRASPFFYLITTIELVSSSFRTLFNLTDKLLTQRFENLKMTSLLFKQVKDQYAISTNSIPSWCQEVNKAYPFFTGFPARYLLFKVTAFDLKRSMSNLYVYLRNFLGENLLEDKSMSTLTASMKRVKVKIHREQIYKDTLALMNEYSNYPGYVEFEYFNETGTGMGPTLEYYSLILKEIITNKSLWYNTEDHSLFPIPSIALLDKTEVNNRRKIFECLGFVIARGLFDDRLLDIPLNALFWDLLLNRPVNIDHISLIDKNVGSFLLQLHRLVSCKQETKGNNGNNGAVMLNGKSIESCDIFFTLPINAIPLKDNGENIQLNSSNINEYIWLMFKKLIIEGQKEWIESFKQGFNRVFSINQLRCFSSNEIEEIICGSESSDELWSSENLIQNIIPTHGFTKDSMIYQGLISWMTQMNRLERKMFLLFVTGAPRLPIGGFKNFHPKLTVVMYQSENKILDQYPDSHLPSVMTCQNYLKIPNYSSIKVLKEKIAFAIREGNNAFHLS